MNNTAVVKEIQLLIYEIRLLEDELMVNLWTADVIAQLRIIGITQKEFAKLCGYSEPYMSQVLRGRKSTEQAKETIHHVLRELKENNA